MTSSPGRSHRWNVLPSTICAPISTSSAGAIALTVPYVPTGMNTGVSTTPCASQATATAVADVARTVKRMDEKAWNSAQTASDERRRAKRAGGAGAAPAPTSRIVSARPHCDSVGTFAGRPPGSSPRATGQRSAPKSKAFFHARWKSPLKSVPATPRTA